MKIEKISDSIIRVTISLNDLKEMNIDLNTLNYNTPAVQEFFWDLMEQAEEQLGFDLTDSQLIIEPVPDSGNGFIITITKIDEDGDFESIQKYIKSRLKKSDLKVKKRGRRVCSSLIIYSFKCLEDVCGFADKAGNLYNGESTLYKCGNAYYLMMTRSGAISSGSGKFELILNEYGTKVLNAIFYEGYLNEYGEKIIENNAIEVLNQYF